MFFIGQEHITASLGDILIYTRDTRKGVAILFRGASGYGKTELAKKCCNFLVGKDYEISLGKNPKFNPKLWVHFIDEIHTMETPEILFPIIDAGEYVFVFATNYDSVLPEALINRCKSFIFTDYSDEELMDIFKYHCSLHFSDEVIKHVIDVSGRNPRIMVKTFIDNIQIHYYRNKEKLERQTDNEIIDEIDKLHGIKGGLDRISMQYLECLKALGGHASINLLASSMRLDINTIKYTIEPALLYKKYIRITSKGRELC